MSMPSSKEGTAVTQALSEAGTIPAKTVERLKGFEDSQSAFFLLRVSFGIVRATHFMRTTPLSDWSEESVKFDFEIRSAAETILDDTSYRQACLTPTLGGIGIRRIADHADAAYAASFLEAMAECSESWTIPAVVVSFPASSQKVASYQIDKKIHADLVARAPTDERRNVCCVSLSLTPVPGLPRYPL